ncbi:hypothetical protein, partial [uncultured Oscillibacter sp.]|uniref:hypothetical protein n=1 Tax=uncultured Oscillibacter sp. TaxID=876091 RepID=UPI0026070D49
RSVSGFAENCTLAGISSLSTATRFAGLAAEGIGGIRGRKIDFTHLLQQGESGAAWLSFSAPRFLPAAKGGPCTAYKTRGRTSPG